MKGNSLDHVMLDFWAKSRRDGDLAPMHSIAHHGMDVAACASVLLDTFRAPVGVPSEALAALIALHDIGKFTRTFQGKVEPLWPPSLAHTKSRSPAIPTTTAASHCWPVNSRSS